MTKLQIEPKRLGTIAHYIGVVSEYLIVMFFAAQLNNLLKIPSVFSMPIRVFGFILTVCGFLLIVWCCMLQFMVGQGTTGFSEPTKKLVTCGPYSIVRNPMMYGQFLVFAGLGFLLNLGAMILLLPIIILATHGFIVLIEEPDLKRRFNQEWIDYAKSVPRWFPRLTKTQKNTNASKIEP